MTLNSLLGAAEIPVAKDSVGLLARSLPLNDEECVASETDELARSGRELLAGLDISLLRCSGAA